MRVELKRGRDNCLLSEVGGSRMVEGLEVLVVSSGNP